jgi:hypothetical protein
MIAGTPTWETDPWPVTPRCSVTDLPCQLWLFQMSPCILVAQRHVTWLNYWSRHGAWRDQRVSSCKYSLGWVIFKILLLKRLKKNSNDWLTGNAGSGLGMKNWLRVTFAVDPSLLEDGLERLKSFCLRHAK